MLHETIHLKEYYAFLGDDGRDPTLAFYLPDNLSEMHRELQKRPSLLICPGGAYMMCSQREAEPVALHFLPEGFNVFVLIYSVSPHQFPAQLLEVAAAFDWITHRADHLHCDLERTAIMGFSAGGHLAAHYVNVYRWPEIRDIFPKSHRVAASLLCYPVITTDPAFSHKKSFEFLLGSYPQGETAARFSCEKLVTADTPPTFLWHTAEDENVPVENTLLYAMALSRFDVPYEMHIYPRGLHGLATADVQTNNALSPDAARNHQWIESARNWLVATFDSLISRQDIED